MAPLQQYRHIARRTLRHSESLESDNAGESRVRRGAGEERPVYQVDSVAVAAGRDVEDDQPRGSSSKEDPFDMAVSNLMAQIPTPKHTSRVRFVSESCFDLNPSRSKRLWIGLDLERQLQISVLVENSTNKLGTRLSLEEFNALLLDEGWTETVCKHMRSPLEQPRPSLVLENVEYRLITVNANAPEPALSIRTLDDLYVILGAVTWEYLLRLKPLILLKVNELQEACRENHFTKWLAHSLVHLRDKAMSLGLTPFPGDNACQTFILANFPEFLLSSPPPDLYKYFLNEICYRHIEIYAGLLLYVLSDPTAMQFPNDLLWNC